MLDLWLPVERACLNTKLVRSYKYHRTYPQKRGDCAIYSLLSSSWLNPICTGKMFVPYSYIGVSGGVSVSLTIPTTSVGTKGLR